MPLMTVFLREQGGFDFLQIGLAMSLMNIPMLCSPALITLLADRNVDARKILAIAYTCSSVVLSLMYFSNHIAITLALFIFHGLSFVAMIPLQDGYFFSIAESMRKRGEPAVEYPQIRVWGTVGFILPSLILFYPLSQGASAASILPCAVVFCLLSLANARTLPVVERPVVSGKKLPTRVALGAIFSPKARWLSIGLFFGFMAATTYYAFIGNFLDEEVGIPKRYIGLIINIGVVLEVGFTILMPWLQRKIQLKGILVLGFFCMVARMFLLAFFPYVWVAVVVQICHGLEVLALFVGPVMFLNRLATDEFRNSIQGVFTMAVGGVARVLGGVTAGFVVSEFGLDGGLIHGACLATVAFLIITFLFRRIPPADEQDELVVSPEDAS